MSTKTMRLPPRRVAMPTESNSTNKRKERDSFVEVPKAPASKLPKPVNSQQAGYEPTSNNQLLAGYMAHEFLTKGTLFGQPFVLAGSSSEAMPPQQPSQLNPSKEEKDQNEAEPTVSRAEPSKEDMKQRYMEVTRLLKTNGTHIPGIVNPTQLTRFLQM